MSCQKHGKTRWKGHVWILIWSMISIIYYWNCNYFSTLGGLEVYTVGVPLLWYSLDRWSPHSVSSWIKSRSTSAKWWSHSSTYVFFQMEIVMKLGFYAGLKLVRYFCRLTFIIYIHLYTDIPISLLLKSSNKTINPWFPSLKTHAFGSADANPTRVVHGAVPCLVCSKAGSFGTKGSGSLILELRRPAAPDLMKGSLGISGRCRFKLIQTKHCQRAGF